MMTRKWTSKGFTDRTSIFESVSESTVSRPSVSPGKLGLEPIEYYSIDMLNLVCDICRSPHLLTPVTFALPSF